MVLGRPISWPCSITRLCVPSGKPVEVVHDAGKTDRRRAGRRILRHAELRGEHARMERRTVVHALARIEVDAGDVVAERLVPTRRARCGPCRSPRGSAPARRRRYCRPSRHMALWFSKPISRGSRPSASAMRSRAGGDALAFSGSFGASNSANGACPSRRRTPTRTEPIACSSRMMTSLSPLTSGVRACASRIAVPMVGWPANGSSRAGVKMRTRAECAGFSASARTRSRTD